MKGCRPLTDIEVKKIINGYKNSEYRYAQRDLALFVYGLVTGYRISELLSMRIKDVSHNWKVHGYASVRRAFTKGKNEGDTKQIEPWAQKYMQVWIDDLRAKKHKKTDWLWQSQIKGNSSCTRQHIYVRFKEICTSNGIYGNTGLHSMRKTFTNKLRIYFERKVKDSDIPFNPAEELQKEGRWKSAEAMDKYLSFRKIDFKETVFDYEN